MKYVHVSMVVFGALAWLVPPITLFHFHPPADCVFTKYLLTLGIPMLIYSMFMAILAVCIGTRCSFMPKLSKKPISLLITICGMTTLYLCERFVFASNLAAMSDGHMNLWLLFPSVGSFAFNYHALLMIASRKKPIDETNPDGWYDWDMR